MQEMIDFLNANIQQEGGVKRYLEKVKKMDQQNPDLLKEWNYSSLIQFIFDYPNLEKVHPDFWLILAALWTMARLVSSTVMDSRSSFMKEATSTIT